MKIGKKGTVVSSLHTLLGRLGLNNMRLQTYKQMQMGKKR